MRTGVLLFAVLLVGPALGADKDGTRHGVKLDAKTYPQDTPKTALAAILKALKATKYDYVAAQLADPTFIDTQVKTVHGGKFSAAVDDLKASLDEQAIKLLERFSKDGKWTIDKTSALVRLKNVEDRCVRLIKKGDRWYLEHGSTPPKDD